MNVFKHTRLALATALAGAALLGAGGAVVASEFLDEPATTVATPQVTVSGDATPAASSDRLSVGEVYKRAYRGVVEITASAGGTRAPGGGGRSQGSGFVYDDEGHVITNQHVVDSATSASVQFWNGKRYSATIVGTDPSTDLAVLKVDAPASALHPIPLAKSAELEIGDGVVAIGSPFGLEQTVTAGIVSALHRQITAPNDFAIDDAIQTDAAINHGNSGGPLLDLSGRVVGVNSQIESQSGGNDGVGFAVPSDTLKRIAAALIADGEVLHAYLGVATGESGGRAGAAIAEVRSGTAAARAGLRVGDVVTRVDGEAITTSDELRRAIDAKSPGDTVELTVERGGRTLTLKAQLGTRPSA